MKGQWERNDSSKKIKRLTVYIRYFNWQRKNFITLNHEDYDRFKTMQLFFFFRTMSWNDYLLELAIYIIAARSNLSPVPVEGSEWTKSVVVSTEMDCDMKRTSLWYQLIVNHEDLFLSRMLDIIQPAGKQTKTVFQDAIYSQYFVIYAMRPTYTYMHHGFEQNTWSVFC